MQHVAGKNAYRRVVRGCDRSIAKYFAPRRSISCSPVITYTATFIRPPYSQHTWHMRRHASTNAWRSQAINAHEDSTIYALSTAPGRAAIAIIRISGPACQKIYHSLCPNHPLPKPRHAALRTLHSPGTPTSILDSGALVLYFPAPHTSTGEPVLELHIHGGPATIRAVLSAIATLHTPHLPIRHAQPGEFTRRAFLADRLTLPQIEALGDTLAAETEEQRRLSVAGARSGLAARYEAWRARLLSARAELEALIDFSEDQHFDESPRELTSNVARLVRGLVRAMRLHAANASRGELLRAGIQVSLVGAPNVGKSSLLNQIVGRRAAIVSATAGTTRDVVEVGVDLGGFFVRLGDTAGLRGGVDVGDVEGEGIRRAKERAGQSDVVVLVVAADEAGGEVCVETELLETALELIKEGKRIVVALNKVDRCGPADLADILERIHSLLPGLRPNSIFPISCRRAEESSDDLSACPGSTTDQQPVSTSTDSGVNTDTDPGNIHNLLAGLTTIFRNMTSALLPSSDPTYTSPLDTDPSTAPDTNRNDPSTYADALSATTRQRTLLESCIAELTTFLTLVEDTKNTEEDIDIVLAAEALRSAASCLAQITGKCGEAGGAGDVEEVLGVVFERFCVGK